MTPRLLDLANLVPQGFQAAGELRFHRLFGDAELLGDLGVASARTSAERVSGSLAKLILGGIDAPGATADNRAPDCGAPQEALARRS
jgi:hypothetical protein